MNFKEYLTQKRSLVEMELEKYLEELTYPEVIAQGMKYAVLNGGKRIRPILLLMTLEVLNTEIIKGLPTALAIELIHCYSLVHDDLPALDNDDYRRGKLTTHKKFGEAQGILIGDALLTHAFYILSGKNTRLSSDEIVKIISLTSNYAGINGMIGGQMIDMESEGKKIDIATLEKMHKNKTGKLLRLPVEVATIIGNANESEKKALIEYSELIGLAFQVKDDILDIEGEFENIGKPVGSDLEREKSTYPSIIGLDESKKLLSKTLKKAIEVVYEIFGEKANGLIELAKYIESRNK